MTELTIEEHLAQFPYDPKITTELRGNIDLYESEIRKYKNLRKKALEELSLRLDSLAIERDLRDGYISQ